MSSYISLPIFAASVRERYRLEEPRCAACGTLNVPSRIVCLECGRGDFQWERLSGTGTIYTFTVIARGGAPTEFDEQQTMTGALVAAVVELEEGAKVVAQLTDCRPETVSLDMPVRAVFRRLYDQEGIVRYGYKFVPAQGEGSHGI